jgi:hypothetical protein
MDANEREFKNGFRFASVRSLPAIALGRRLGPFAVGKILGTLRVCARSFSAVRRVRNDPLLFTRDGIYLLGRQAADYRTDESGFRFGVSVAIITVSLRQGSL